MMTDCGDPVETPVQWHDQKKKKKNRVCFESSLFPWVSRMYKRQVSEWTSELVSLTGLAG